MHKDTPREKHNHGPLDFPEGFLWGAATSAHQVEGNNIYNDWWAWEQRHQPVEKRSGQAVDQYNLYEEDFKLAEEFNHNAHRLSIEWSRIEPEEGMINHEAIDHYVEVLRLLKKKKMKVMLTLWHFTLPKWVADRGGWENKDTVGYFEKFIKVILPRLADYVDLWVTINEPGVYVYTGYLTGMWPPQKKSKWKGFKVYWHLALAHKRVYKIIHQHIKGAKVGIANNVASFGAFHRHNLGEDLAVWILDTLGNHLFYKLSGIKTHDFLGLNYYFNHYVSFNGEAKFPELVDVSVTQKDVSDLGWEIYPEGIFDVIMDFSDYHLPIYITENGMASTNDDRRCRMLISFLKEIYHAISSGVEVKGYFHWSLTDNFEWADGFNPRFGLIEIDYHSLKRIPRPSCYVYSEIAKNNGLPHHLLRFIGHTVQADDVLTHHDHDEKDGYSHKKSDKSEFEELVTPA